MAYTVTSALNEEQIKTAILKNLKSAEALNNTDAFALAFDNNTKKLYMVFSEAMVAKNASMSEHMVEIKADTSALNDEIANLKNAIQAINGDGGVLGSVSDVDLSSYYTKDELENKLNLLKNELSQDKKEYITKQEASELFSGGVVNSGYEKFVVVGVWGQSNAVGYDEGEVNAFDVAVNENRIFQISAIDNTLKPLTYCAENLQNMNTVIPQGFVANGMSAKPQAGTKGIHLPLANLICSAIPDDYGVIMVPYAFGGQAISYFTNATRVNGFTNNIKKALDLNSANVFAGIIWCQGENNSANTTGASYKASFQALVNDVNSKLQAYANRTSGGVINAKSWYFYEYPKFYKDQTYGREIMNAIKEVVGEANYIALRENHPVNITKYTSRDMAAHYAGDFYRTDIAPKVFKAMSNNGVFFANSRDDDSKTDLSSLNTQISALQSQILALQNALKEQGVEISEEQALRILTSSDVSVGYWKTKQPSVSVDGSGTLTIGNGGGAGAIMLPANITHFEGTTNGKNFTLLVAGDDNGGLGFFAQTINNNQFYWAKSNADAGFSTAAVAGRTNASSLSSAKLVIDIEGQNVKVMLGEQVIFNGDVSGGVGGDSTYTTPRIGFGASWSGSNPGNIVFSDCKVR